MLEVFECGKEVKKSSLSSINGTATYWMRVINPTAEELKKVTGLVDLDSRIIKQALDPEERPHIYTDKKTDIIFFQAPLEGKRLSTSSFSIILHKNMMITLSKKRYVSIDRFKDNLEKGLIQKGGNDYLAYELLSSVMNHYFELLDKLEEDIDHLENQVIHTPSQRVLQRIFTIKRTVTYFHKALNADREVIASVEKNYLGQVKKKTIPFYNALYHDVVQLIDEASTYRDILTNSLEMYMSSVSNNLNEVMKKLTVIASFVLVPTLISGIYGMNFREVSPWNMPELYWDYGYFFALGLMVVSVLLMYWWFKSKDWL